ncbi:MAG: S9 family peptidase, partial [Proteobacteria bacterium]|nr:S9 family peptidase [Pseudomonadota bacterium]
MKIIACVASALILLSSPIALADDLKPFDRMDVFELEWVSDPQISPDGRRVVYVRNGMDVMTDDKLSRLWLSNTDGTHNVPLMGRDINESNPVWSPDGRRIAFKSKTDAGTEIFVVWVESGKSTRLTQLNRSPNGLSWSPDGNHIAFSMLVPEDPVVLVKAPKMPDDAKWSDKPRVTTRLKYERDGSGYIEPGYKQFFVISALGGTPRQVTFGNFRHDGTPRWSRDGRSLIFTGNRNDDWELSFRNSEIYSVPVSGGEIVALTDRNGPDAEPVVSPDGRKIAYVSHEDKVQTYQVANLHVMNIDGSGKRDLLHDLDRSVADLVWNKGSDGIYYQYGDRGDTKIGFTTLADRSKVIATNLGGTTIGRPYGGGSFSVSDNGTIAYTHATPYRPAELAIVDRGRGEANVITSFNADVLGWRTLGKVEELWYKSSVDGRDIQGWVVTPPGHDASKPYPLLVENHGGPISGYGPYFSPEMQLYAAAGYVVFYPNPRGSTGYGEEFGNLLYHNYPGDDYQDVMDGVDALIESGVTAEDRLYVTGGSAGGIMTAWIIGKNNRFRAAAVVKPVMNWISKTLSADNYFMYANYRYPGQPWESVEAYMKFSPISLVGNIETPTMVMVGTADLRTGLSESKQLYGALKIRGIETALVEVPDAP